MNRTITRTIPERTEKLVITFVSRGFWEYGEKWRSIRSKNDHEPKHQKCWWCHRLFEDGEQMALVGVRGKLNKLVCDKCAGEIEEVES